MKNPKKFTSKIVGKILKKRNNSSEIEKYYEHVPNDKCYYPLPLRLYPKKGEYILCIKNNVEDGLIDFVHFLHKGRICSSVWTNIKRDYELIELPTK